MLFSKVQKAIRSFFGGKEESTPVRDMHVEEIALEVPMAMPIPAPPPLLPFVTPDEFKLIRRLNTPGNVAKMLSIVVAQNRQAGTHQEWTTREYDALELILKTLTLREEAALVKIVGCPAGGMMGVADDRVVTQYAIQDGDVFEKLRRTVDQIKILEMGAHCSKRIRCHGYIASSGGHRYLFISFFLEQMK